MSFVHPRVRPLFESLSPKVQREILKNNCKIYTERDLTVAVSGLGRGNESGEGQR